MKLGKHVHYTKTSKYSYSAKPDYAWGGCGGHFPKWPLSQKLRGAEPSISILYIGFVRRRFQKKYCQMYHTILSDIQLDCERHFSKWRPFPKYYGLSQKLRGAERSILTLCLGFVRRRFQKTYCQMYHTILSDIVNAIFKMAATSKVLRSISETKSRRAFNVDSIYRFCGA